MKRQEGQSQRRQCDYDNRGKEGAVILETKADKATWWRKYTDEVTGFEEGRDWEPKNAGNWKDKDKDSFPKQPKKRQLGKYIDF